MIRFHLDEHVDHAIARALRARGVDVTTTSDASLLGARDEDHLVYARLENRVVFSNDADFLRLAQSGVPHTGIIYCAPGSRSIGDIVRYLCLLSDCLNVGDMNGQVEYL